MAKPSRDLQLPDSVWLTTEDFESLCFNTARESWTFKEPIPDYSTRDNALLEPALGSPRQTFDKKLLYPNLSEQASILFYSLIKNHPFVNRNKRVAVMSLLIFLALNGKWIEISSMKLYELAILVSESRSRIRERITKDVAKIINKYMIDRPKNF